MGQIDDGTSLSGDNLVAERTVQKFTADKKDTVYGEDDTDPDDNIVKIDIEIFCHVIARHDGGKERPQSDAALHKPEEFIFDQFYKMDRQ